MKPGSVQIVMVHSTMLETPRANMSVLVAAELGHTG